MKQHSAKYRVYYEDTDAQGVIYYANYLRFAERARTDFLRENGARNQIDMMKETGVFFVVRRAEIEYLLPGRLDDILEIKTEVTRIGKTSIEMQQECFNQLGDKLTSIFIQIVCVTNDGNKIKSIKLSDDLIKDFSD